MTKKRKSIQDRLRKRFHWTTWQRYPGNPAFALPNEQGLSYRNGAYMDGKPKYYTDLFYPRIEICPNKRYAGGLEYSVALDRYIEKEDGEIIMCQMTPGYREHCCFWFRMSFEEIKALYEMGIELIKEGEQE